MPPHPGKRKLPVHVTNVSQKRVKIDPGPESILFVPHTPYSELKTLVQKEENKINSNRTTRVKIIERNGPQIKHELCNKTPWKRECCSNPDCIACSTVPGSCRKRNLLYKAVCVQCAVAGISSIYWGETHRGWTDRLFEHTKAIEAKNPTYATVRHNQEFNPDSPPNLPSTITAHI